MQEANHRAGQRRCQRFVRFGGVGQVHRFAFFDQRANPIDLPAFGQLAADALDHLVAPALTDHLGHHRCAPGRQLVDGRHIQVGVVAHGQRARNRRGRHHQEMRLLTAGRHLGAQGQPLRHAKAVLLVDDRQRQVLEAHLVLDHRVRAHHQGGGAAFDQGQCLAPLLGFLAAGQPGGLYAQRLQPADEFAKMLLGQNFGGRHQCALPAGVHAAGRRQRRHHGLSRAHIALQQAVHGQAFLQVGIDLVAHALLCGGQRKGQGLAQLRMQRMTRRPCGVQRRRAHGRTDAPGLQLRELLRQQLLGFEPLPGGVAAVFQRDQRHVRRGVMQKLQGLA